MSQAINGQAAPGGERAAEQVLDEARQLGLRLLDRLGCVIFGQGATLEGVVLSLLSGGHVLLEGAPGLGKTQMARAVATLAGGSFARIQFTPDLMPSDVTGTSLVVSTEGGGKDLAYRPGPIFANFVLADEINRATPKTQSALLEAMAERTVTVEGRPRPLPEPFFVLATENPIEMEGVFPLPEAQLDRFLVKLIVPMPDIDTLARIGARSEPTYAAGAITSPEELRRAQFIAGQVPAAYFVQRYAARLILATHEDPAVRYGAGPRAVQALMAMARCKALLDGRAAVGVDDLRGQAHAVLRHRIGLRFEAEAQGVDVHAVIDRILERTPVES